MRGRGGMDNLQQILHVGRFRVSFTPFLREKTARVEKASGEAWKVWGPFQVQSLCPSLRGTGSGK